MNNAVPAFNAADEEYGMISGEDVIELMFSRTRSDRILYVPQRPYLVKPENIHEKFLKCAMVWTEEDKDRLIGEYRELLKALNYVALEGVFAHEDISDYDMDISDIDIKYMLTEPGTDPMLRRLEKDLFAAGEDKLRYWHNTIGLKRLVTKRFGSSEFAFDEFVRAKKICMLYEEGMAGSKEINREMRLLAQFMALRWFCRLSKPVTLASGWGFFLEDADPGKLWRYLQEQCTDPLTTFISARRPETVLDGLLEYDTAEMIAAFDSYASDPLEQMICEDLERSVPAREEPILFDVLPTEHGTLICYRDYENGRPKDTTEETLAELYVPLRKLAARLGIDAEDVRYYCVEGI